MDARSLIALMALMLSCSLMVECKAEPGVEHSGSEQLSPQRCEHEEAFEGCFDCCDGDVDWDSRRGRRACWCHIQLPQQQQQQQESQQDDERRCEHKQNYGDCKECCGGNVLDHAAVKGRCLCAGHPHPRQGEVQQADESRRPEKIGNNDNAASTQLDRETCKERFEELFTVTMKVPEEIQNLIEEINKIQPEVESMNGLDWSKIKHLYTYEHRQKCREYLQSGLKAFVENQDLNECQKVVGLPEILAFLETKEFAKAFPICYRLTM